MFYCTRLAVPLLKAAGGGVKLARIPERCQNEADGRRLWEISEQLTEVSY